MKTELESAVILVTGAAAGIGRAIAEHAAGEGVAGLFLTDIDGAGLSVVAEALKGQTEVHFHAVDLAGPTAPAAIFEQAKARFGGVTGLVNAAGITTRASFTNGSADLWDRLFAINARAPYLLMSAFINDARARETGGTIVNIQSMNAHCGAPELAIYASTKGALQTLTKNAANAHLRDGIRVNGINLGWTLTEAEDQIQSETHSAGLDWAQASGVGLPLGRLILPDEAARLAIYLLSPASAPMTGVSLDLEQSVVGAPR
jgi:NAD(P)-dependent dehydrogenase (short-subunit alcohol dehydrogenase family)